MRILASNKRTQVYYPFTLHACTDARFGRQWSDSCINTICLHTAHPSPNTRLGLQSHARAAAKVCQEAGSSYQAAQDPVGGCSGTKC